MLPVLLRWEWNGHAIRLGAYPTLIFCGLLAALVVVLRRTRDARLSPRDLLPVFTWSIVIGFLGARLLAAVQSGGHPLHGGFVLYGGLIAGFGAGLAAARWKGLPPLAVADLAAPAVLLAAAFGRLGCLLAGCCYGVVSPIGISYPRGSHAFRDQVRHGLIGSTATESLPTMPIALLESAVFVLLFLIASDLWRRRLRPGTVLGAAGLLYPAWRFVAEFWRADNLPWWPGGLTFSQGISVALLALSGACFILRARTTSASSLAALPFRPASAVQVAVLLAALGLSLSGINCGSHQTHETSGVHQYRKTPSGAGDQKTPPSGNQKDHDSGDWFGDCVGECTEECIDDCTDAMCEEACSDGPDEDEAPQPPLNSVLGTIVPGQEYKGSISFEAVVNDRLSVVLKLEGRLLAWKAFSDGMRPMRFRFKKVDLTVGDSSWHGSGDVNVEVGPLGDVHLIQSTLPPDLLNALAALDKLTGNLLWGVRAEEPISDLASVVQEELAVPNPKAGFSMRTRIEGHEKWLVGEANVVKDPDGTYKLVWNFTS